ncbi:hypothetical protein ACJA29_02545 [Metamycoplasma sualvi]|uniref:hypothetical protein n=1 Tax=Metamycoplasma sualvi TaxID=2125 RepID=UPI003873B0AF
MKVIKEIMENKKTIKQIEIYRRIVNIINDYPQEIYQGIKLMSAIEFNYFFTKSGTFDLDFLNLEPTLFFFDIKNSLLQFYL